MTTTDATPPHCYARSQRLLSEIRLIREEMGGAEDARPLSEITGAVPREAYFGALALHRRAERLAREHSATPIDAPPPVPSLLQIRPGHVLDLIGASLDHLEGVKSSLRITERSEEPALETARQPSDVLLALSTANRELDRLLQRRFTPEDVYAPVTLASAYAARLLTHAGTSGPAMAPFERKKRPSDCYERLAACLSKVGRLVASAGQSALAAPLRLDGAVPGDVHDLAWLVLGEVAFLQSLTPGASAPPPFERLSSGHRLPSHVHQAASTLDAQLTALIGG